MSRGDRSHSLTWQLLEKTLEKKSKKTPRKKSDSFSPLVNTGKNSK